jgi:hypothetical protein
VADLNEIEAPDGFRGRLGNGCKLEIEVLALRKDETCLQPALAQGACSLMGPDRHCALGHHGHGGRGHFFPEALSA